LATLVNMRRTLLYVAWLALVSGSPVSARSAFFWDIEQGTRLSVDYLEFEDSGLESPAQGEIGGQRSTTAIQYDFSSEDGWALCVGHEYNALDIDVLPTAEPRTNGDLHTLSLATRWLGSIGPGRLQLAAAPALSLSSNALKDTDTWDSSSLQWWGAATYTVPGDTVNWVAGLARDHRFGDPRTYPLVGLKWSDDLHQVLLTYPDISVVRALGESWLMGFTTAPDGNRWQAWDRDLEASDDFRREAWQSELFVRYGFRSGIRLGLAVGYHWSQRWKYRTQSGVVSRVDSDDSGYIGLHLGWQPI